MNVSGQLHSVVSLPLGKSTTNTIWITRYGHSGDTIPTPAGNQKH